MKKKQIAICWMGRSDAFGEPMFTDSQGNLCIDLPAKRGKKSDWEVGEWPPIKVTITAEWETPD